MRNKNLVLFLVIGIITCLGLFVTGCTPSGTNYLVGSADTVKASVANNDAIKLPVNQITAGAISETTGPSTFTLGAASSFAILGGNAGITNQGLLTSINGDIGTTGVDTKITGFRDSSGINYTVTPLNNGMVNGIIYTTAAGNQALTDARNAFNSLSPASLSGGTDPGAGQLGGLTLTPGIYKSNAGSFLITGADLTLDARGNLNAIFVFQMASSLTVGAPGAPRSVNLINGAQAKNVFWQVGSAATINGAGGGTMVGTIISYASTTFSTAGNAAVVTLNGRALALNASVTMVNTVINVPGNNAPVNSVPVIQTATGSSGTTSNGPVSLGAAASFASFGGNAGMTNQGGLTIINGDIGTTGVSTMMTGFRDSEGNNYTTTPLNNGKVNGRIYTTATFDTVNQVLADANTAFKTLVSLTGGIDPGKGQLGGLTLTLGIYKAGAGSFLITGADLTLDARGDSNALFIFQMSGSLTVGAPGAPRSIYLINGAQAKNVFWQVGSAATINGAGGGTMVGTIISYASTTFSTAGNAAVVTLNGRALALNASVTMVNTVINVPDSNLFGNQNLTSKALYYAKR